MMKKTILETVGLSFVASIVSLVFISQVLGQEIFNETNESRKERLIIAQRQWHKLQIQIDPLFAQQLILHDSAKGIRKELCDNGEKKYCPPTKNVFVTTYNNEPAQTDSTPCDGSGGNVCEAYEMGKRPIAVSPDLRLKYGLRFGDRVTMSSPVAHCGNGDYMVLDNLPSRSGVDIFVPKEKKKTDNTSCHASFQPLVNMEN